MGQARVQRGLIQAGGCSGEPRLGVEGSGCTALPVAPVFPSVSWCVAGNGLPERKLHPLHLGHQHPPARPPPAPAGAPQAASPPFVRLHAAARRRHLAARRGERGGVSAPLLHPGAQRRRPDRVFQLPGGEAEPTVHPTTLHLGALPGPARRLARLRLR